MKILFVTAEATPLAQVGGLAEVCGSLPQALIRIGHDVRLIIPQYGCMDLGKYDIAADQQVTVVMDGGNGKATINRFTLDSVVPAYSVENRHYFGGNEVYGDCDLERFLFFSRAVAEMLKSSIWQPDIVHCHDWHSAILTSFLKEGKTSYGTLFTIHNLAYQGQFDTDFLAAQGLEEYWKAKEGTTTGEVPLNFMVQGIMNADMVNTVSPEYAREIATPVHGEGLNEFIAARGDGFAGILNGIDYDEYNPETDPYIPLNYGQGHPAARAVNKKALQLKAGLPCSELVPLIGMVQRLDEQKGIDILLKALGRIMSDTNAQFVVLGRGREEYESQLRQIVAAYPGRIVVEYAFDTPLARLIYAGCDLFLLPSRFEPCGLGQLIAMRYGAIPLVRHTGGLVDTVPPFNADLTTGNGFVFHDYTTEALSGAIEFALRHFDDRPAWEGAVTRVMRVDNSWNRSAGEYDSVYRRILTARASGNQKHAAQ